ncbi:MAG: radical SAM family heme chaperone HemW [Gemmatimonadaceae bacterium]
MNRGLINAQAIAGTHAPQTGRAWPVYSDMPASHLYIHVPFCGRRCSYCDFSIAVRAKTPVDEYLTALRAELGGQRGSIGLAALDTVYLGGGTPSRLGGLGVRDALNAVRENGTIAADAEVTIEANPDDVNDMAVAHWVAAGVNRVSLGAQSFNDEALRWMHRTHGASQIVEAVRTLQRGGIQNISLDLIFALPTHLNRSWEADLDQAIALEPAHLSLYGLTVETKTPIARWADRGAVVQGSEENYEEEFLTAHSMMASAGFEHYEVSNFARPALGSRHNSAYWTGEAYAGVGPSAHSFDGAVRSWNVAAYSEWLRRLALGESVIAGEETLTDENRTAEEVYLGLRTQRGLAITQSYLPRVRVWESQGWAAAENHGDPGRVRLSPTGWLRLDSLAADLATGRSSPVNTTIGATPSHCYI